ncbi:O-antigen ligase family protein [Candidatus Cetobacterium colombiensis]|uniref:O-antigen ligase family protein n=1 Tax=Candidatus Cetobacterium colombiensis TaxID=3073100 RepID=A0ABU4W8T8_9FUSO|nr:O-antigen ligase family protein [Candidatus Cetobacterium colombiensis]MDX8335928.1 O-antigen ligase family protein [Candidatus Cetobacterium colombiensis]
MIEKINEELLFKYGTYILFPLFILYPSSQSEIFIFYLLLTIIKVKKEGYKKCGLELYIGLAILGLSLSFIGNWHTKILKQVFSVFKILILPLFIYQFKAIENLEKKLFYFFNALGIYGLLEFLVIKSKPINPGAARYYSYLGFFMDSSVVALSGYIYCFLYLIMKREKTNFEKILGLLGTLIFSYLILLHQVRATYLSFLTVTIIILGYIFMKISIKNKIIVFLTTIFLFGAFFKSSDEIVKSDNVYINRIKSIGDTKSNHSNTARFYFWKTAIKTFESSPINGIGYRRFNMNNIKVEKKYEDEFYHAHSEIFSMLAEVGIIGIFLWYLFKFKIFQFFYFQRKRLLGLFLLITFIGFEIQTFFEVYLVAKNTYRYLFMLLGFILTYLKKDELESN